MIFDIQRGFYVDVPGIRTTVFSRDATCIAFGATIPILKKAVFIFNLLMHQKKIFSKQKTDAYKSLRVRVSGFSNHFVKLNCALRDDVISRTTHS